MLERLELEELGEGVPSPALVELEGPEGLGRELEGVDHQAPP
jgi:archaellum biogenesis ATPase FlaH